MGTFPKPGGKPEQKRKLHKKKKKKKPLQQFVTRDTISKKKNMASKKTRSGDPEAAGVYFEKESPGKGKKGGHSLGGTSLWQPIFKKET